MALQTSGQITFLDIQNELGGTNPISLSEYYGIGTLPTSGQISISDFYGEPKLYNGATKCSVNFYNSTLYHTPSTNATNAKKCTLSYWAKFNRDRNVASSDYMVVMANPSQYYTMTGMDSDDTLFFAHYISSEYKVKTTAKFRDQSAWYHVVVQVDTTQATASNRVKIYVNGVQQTLTGSYPSKDAILNWRYNGTTTNIGAFAYSSYYRPFYGYLTNIEFADGFIYPPSTFGEDRNGVWIPKNWAWNNTNMGNLGFSLYIYEPGEGQISGTTFYDDGYNAFSFTCGLAAPGGTYITYDSISYDHPENNFCTLNALNPSYNVLGYGDLRTGMSNGSLYASTSTFTVGSSKKWYWETCIVTDPSNGYPEIGLLPVTRSNLDNNAMFNQDSDGTFTFETTLGHLTLNGTFRAASYTAASLNDVMMFAYDASTRRIWIGLNGTWFNSGNPSAGTGYLGTLNDDWGDELSVAANGYTAARQALNFGQNSSFTGIKTRQAQNTDSNGHGDFYYTPPTNFLALCSANLEVNQIADIPLGNSPGDYFNTVLYTGTSSSQSISGVGFKPDFVWMKNRTSSLYNHTVFDSVRGVYKQLRPDNTAAEDSLTNSLTSFNTDGFSLGSASQQNASGGSYVAWNWKSGNSTGTNTLGTISSSVRANQLTGFSIVSYTGNGVTGSTVGHGLGQAPEFMVIKRRSSSGDWWTRSSYYAGGTYYQRWNTTNSAISSNTLWGNYPGATTFDLRTNTGVNGNGSTYIAYCWHSVEGFSKIGTYTGNGSTDGTFVYTGFRPAYIIIKRTNGAYDWVIIDTARDPYNELDEIIFANSTAVEFTGDSGVYDVDALSNGFKLRGTSQRTNVSGGEYIYMAFAEQPFKYANAR